MMDSDEGPDAPQIEMPRYVSHKKVWALEIDAVGPQEAKGGPARLSFREKGYASIEAPGEMFARYQPIAGDFYVQYADGYKSFSPRKAFLEGYTRERDFSKRPTIAELEKILDEPDSRVHIYPDGSVSSR